MITGNLYAFYKCNSVEERDAYDFTVDQDVIVLVETSPSVTYVGKNGVWKSITSSGSGGYDGDPTTINQDATHRFVSDVEKSTWNDKEEGGTAAGALSAANSYTDSEINDLASATTTALSGKSDTSHNHAGTYEPANANIQSHIASSHAPSNAQANADITKAEIEAKLTGAITSHTHDYAATGHNHAGVYEPVKGSDDNYVTDAEKVKVAAIDQVFTSAEKTKVSNLSGTNSGDQDLSALALKATTITINGDAKDLSTDRSWTVTGSQPDIPQTKIAPSSNQTIAAGYGAYVPFMYELVNGISLELGAGSYLEIG